MEVVTDSVAKIFGRDYLNTADIAKVLNPGVKSEPPEFSPKELALDKIRQAGHFIIERTDRAPDGDPLTMHKMVSLLQPEFTRRDLGQIIYEPRKKWLETQAFYMEDTPRPGIFVVSKGVTPGSLGEDYANQTGLLGNHVLGLARSLSDRGQEAMKEWEDQEDYLKKLLRSDWKNAAERLVALKLNQLYSPKPVDGLHDLVFSLLVNGERRLQDIYTRTCQLASDGGVVYLGRFGPGGAGVRGWFPSFAYPRIGVCSSAELKDLGF